MAFIGRLALLVALYLGLECLRTGEPHWALSRFPYPPLPQPRPSRKLPERGVGARSGDPILAAGNGCSALPVEIPLPGVAMTARAGGDDSSLRLNCSCGPSPDSCAGGFSLFPRGKLATPVPKPSRVRRPGPFTFPRLAFV